MIASRSTLQVMNANPVDLGGHNRAEKQPLMTLSYLANRDESFWSNLGRGYVGHPRMCSHETMPWLTQQKMQKGIHDTQL